MEHKPVTSSSVESYGYNPASKVLEVKFKGSGKTFAYHNVPYETHLRLQTAKSVGQFVHSVIKKHPFKEVS